ncbi:uncharacterized protein LOC122974519 [Thunnus albacares]|uniref:uncharacterized protein LOC122974519 n=1 Tax=Thunnus albacares TaxID=8236 RepID=UPI001CF6BBDF|nr:uncharacterized protein LOC122974519 [Thunnus albacares]
MMERILLGVLYLSGWSIFSTCRLHQYHFVAEPMKWTEAQTYCRETYTDLATIENTEDMNQLNNTVSSAGYNSQVWIGLYRVVDWKWSDGYRGSGDEYRDWASNQPSLGTDKLGVVIGNSRPSWQIHSCTHIHYFVCYNGKYPAKHYFFSNNDYIEVQHFKSKIHFFPNNLSAGTQLDPQFVYVNQLMTWSNAQRYCRENFIDLATVRNNTENQQIHNLVLTKDWTWIGLYGDPDSFLYNWSDGSAYSLTTWGDKHSVSGSLRSMMCGVQESNQWTFMSCGERFPFVCYSIPGEWFTVLQWNTSKEGAGPLPDFCWTEQRKYGKNRMAADTKQLQAKEEELMKKLMKKEELMKKNCDTSDTESCSLLVNSASLLRRQQGGQKASPVRVHVLRKTKYHFVAEPMNWTEAQTFCRETYTDLVTIENTEDMNQLINTVSSAGYNNSFFLNNLSAGTQLDPQFVFVNQEMSWFDAQRYCRENFIDLATVRNDAENQEVMNLVPSGDYVWIGLYRDPGINWSDGSAYSLTTWVLVKRWVVKLRMKVQDSSVDLNDPAVKANILKKLCPFRSSDLSENYGSPTADH